MKTTAENFSFPTAKQLFAFMFLIAGLAFASCIVSSGQVYNNIISNTGILENLDDGYANVLKSGVDLNEMTPDRVWEYRLKSALVEVHEADIELESWMVSGAVFEPVDRETEIRLEEWMTGYYGPSLSFLIVEPEPEPELEEWMLDSEYFITEPADEDPLELEDWMIEY
jgi:hypothetical protein